ncbi:MAG: hypothetical protein OMM_12234 [Candidatus Magnetoglobus multicellularis str. Araruama]|uniref:Uncharacterized protein n=1 Tax=Candidatus Magnetoglobus multicellularis str. Araruama TaxID=890399 RepID=A0A1V1NWA5_9BACT|nr:MAG: hypothetical protein OMM_12234 [Candidatus Magnetoglobus multicellularis str. Araruama]
MNKKLSWKEMIKIYPDEWLLIVDFEVDNSGRITNGTVERHSKDKNDVYKLPTLNKSSAFRYTGKSTFAGLRSHAKQLHFI